MPWHQQRLSNLQKAADSFPDPTSVIEEGLAALATRRNNDTVDGSAATTRLQLLWLEFPTEHFQPLREGRHMNFLRAPAAVIHDNAAMDAEQILVAAAFVDELLDLGLVRTPAEGREVLTTAPLFVGPKEGQEGE
jgi:hypothetical protein